MENHPPTTDTTVDLDTNTIPSATAVTTDTTTTTTTKDSLDTALADQKTHDYDSSDLELSSSDDDDSDQDDNNNSGDDDNDDDEDDEHGEKPTVPRSKNEVTDIAVDTPVIKEITSDMRVEIIGKIVNVLDKTIVVQQNIECSTILDMGSLLVFTDDRHVLGEVFETFGPVECPFYSVRFNTVEEIDPVRTIKGATIGYVPGYERTQLVQVEQLKLIKGTDASNQYDEEVGADEIEFSDDEKEMEYRRKSKKKGKQGKGKQQQQRVQKRPLEDAEIPDGRRQLQSYADIMAPTSSMQQPTYPVTRPPTNQHPDSMTALLNSYMSNQQPQVNGRVSQQPRATVAPIPQYQPAKMQKLATQSQQQPQQFPTSLSQPSMTQVQQQQPTPIPQCKPSLVQPPPVTTQQQPHVQQQLLPTQPSLVQPPPITIQQQQPQVQEQAQTQPPPPPQQQTTSTSFFQSIRSLFSRAPPPS